MSIHVPEDLEIRLRERAEAEGITVDDLVARELGRLFPPRQQKRVLRGKGALRGAAAAGVSARSLTGYMRAESDES
ncbi:hypothetical protein OUY22_14960 [Nonomuraea sp. MCN248]|uniref:Ribbon-helix-helix protein, CopG family n=1 Tax=Nonomuraea corallina TaxID=2989783 RepID=A0ABT4SC03_9ACTN|nr:hypothetical protein [Nonomuraea corallina]MDA0634722.1 hypothetical protein [Nonomuraea corallina]